MNNFLEKFVHKNRNGFDSENPSSDVWLNIEKALPKKDKAKVFSIGDIYKWSAVAAILFASLTSAYFLWIRKTDTLPTVQVGEKNFKNNDTGELGHMQPQTPMPDQTMTLPEVNNVAPEYVADVKHIYQSIETKQAKLKSVTKDEPKLYKQFAMDLKTLDSSYKVLKNQVELSPNRDVIILAMKQNLELQAELLGRQLRIMQDYKHIKTLKNEKNNIQSM